MNLLTNICFLQEYFYQKISQNPNYSFEPSDRENQYILSFVTLLKKHFGDDLSSIGTKTLFGYFLFQYNSRYEQDTRFGKGTVMLNWIIGKKAFDKWVNRKETVMFYEHRFLDIYNASEEDFKSIYSPDIQENNIDLSYTEENDKQRFYNTERGLITCINTTTLYNHRSKWCLTCRSKTTCKKLLKSTLLQIYRERGYWAKDIKDWKNAIENRRVQKV